MSSPRPSAILRSSVFQLILMSCAAFVVAAIGILWSATQLIIWSIDADQEAEITEVADELRAVFAEAGLRQVMDLIEVDGRAIWREDFIYEVLEEGGILAVIRREDGSTLAGYPGLHGPLGWSIEELDHEEIEHPVTTFLFDLDEDRHAVVGRFVPDRRQETVEFAQSGTVALAFIVLPLALITGFFVSGRVLARLETLAKTSEAVSHGALSERAALAGNNDEFDRLARAINHMLDRLETLNRNIEAVSVGAAHDLKTPLANIAGRFELMLRDLAAPDALVEHIAAAQGHLAGLLRTLEALLRLGEIEAGTRRVSFMRIDLAALTRELGESYAEVFEEADKRLTLIISGPVEIEGDRDLLAQLIVNLLENVLDHARDGAQAWLRLEPSGGVSGPTIEIGDDGPGIPAPMRERIFERFVRGDPSRSTPGNGLGLSLVKAIADLHAARIELVPNMPGAVFRIAFST